MFKQVTKDDSPTGLGLISSDLKDTPRDSYRDPSRVFLLKTLDGNSFSWLLDKELSRNKHQMILKNYVKTVLNQFMFDQFK